MASALFIHPEPRRSRKRIWPVFLPFAGCSHRCVFCSQHAQTGVGSLSLDEHFANLELDLNEALRSSTSPLELGFFGGTFTALPEPWPLRFVSLARSFREKGLITRIRCSTRPDAVSPLLLSELKQAGLDMVELGIQSFSSHALADSRRGYAPETALDACRLVRRTGLDLGIQLMPGMPGSSLESFSQDIALTTELLPAAVRLYPCLVLADTPLARRHATGEFHPWSLARTVTALSLALLRLWKRSIPVIRMGLTPEKELDEAFVAGPRHPALGFVCRSLALQHIIRYHLAGLGYSAEHPAQGLRLPRRYAPELWGHKREHAPGLARLGLTPDTVRTWNSPLFHIL